MKRLFPIAAVIVVVAFTVILRPWESRFEYHFRFPLPPTASLTNYSHGWGRDYSYEFEFAVTDDALRDAIIKRWDLKPPVHKRDPMSFAACTGVTWWPGTSLEQSPERYGRVDETTCRYWSLWVDRTSGKLYAEYGNW